MKVNLDKELVALVQQAESIIPRGQKFSVSFSGGKDSSALVCLVVSCIEKGLVSKADVSVMHSDTTIEYPKLKEVTFKVLSALEAYGIKTTVVSADVENLLFASIFGKGRPIPDYRIRWCTSQLKIVPQTKARRAAKGLLVVTGEHMGESSNRDKKLGKCGAGDCGVADASKIAGEVNTIKPLLDFRNCHIWDYLFAVGDHFLFDGFFNQLSEVYNIASDSEGSIRTGCISCPVVNTSRSYFAEPKGVPSRLSLKLRLIFEEMRTPDYRVMNPKKLYTNNAKGELYKGALALDVRKKYWSFVRELSDEFSSIGFDLITKDELEYVEESLKLGRYPVTYKKELILELESEWELRARVSCPWLFS